LALALKFLAQLETAETRSPVLDVGTVVSIGSDKQISRWTALVR